MIINFIHAALILLLAVYVYFMIKFIRLWRNTPDFSFSGKNSSGSLNLSVVIPFYNEKKNLPRLLVSLNEQQAIPGSVEIVFVDDNSTDSSAAIVEEFCRHNSNCHLLKNSGKGKKSALRTGVEKSQGELIVTTDADCALSGRQLKTVQEFQKSTGADLIIMPVAMTGTRTFVQRFFSADFLALQMVSAGSAVWDKPLMCNGANLAFRKPAVDVDLKENYSSGEDMFLLEWMKKRKKRISYLKSKEVLVRTPAPKTLKQFISQRSRWLSKAGGYRDPFLIFFSLLIFSVNLFSLVLLVATIIFPGVWLFWVLWFGIKTLTDLSLLRSGSGFFGFSISFPEFALMQILYPFYMLWVTFRGFFTPVKWK